MSTYVGDTLIDSINRYKFSNYYANHGDRAGWANLNARQNPIP